jgi:hypothetical protein
MRYVPGVLGAACLVVGAAMVLPAVGFAVAGLLLLALDRRMV